MKQYRDILKIIIRFVKVITSDEFKEQGMEFADTALKAKDIILGMVKEITGILGIESGNKTRGLDNAMFNDLVKEVDFE